MARTYTALQLIDQALTRAEQSGSNFISQNEALDYLNSARAELDEFLYSAYNGDYNLTDYSLTTVANSASYVLPTDFYRLSNVALQEGNRFYSLDRINMREKNRMNNSLSAWPRNAGYRIEGTERITFFPTPNNASTIIITYQPAPAIIIDTSTVIPDYNGYSTFIVDTIAMKVALKMEMYERVGYLKASREEWKKAIIENAQQNDLTQPGKAFIRGDAWWDDDFDGGYW
ncbi:MAG: hypothetical protein HC875_10490 [Anaerolineales bacterium]|nr:hypothetical protein [Anaerolineales bacterium]